MLKNALARKKAAYLGVGLIALGVFLFNIGNAVAKDASESLSIGQVVFLRCCFGITMLSGYALLKGDLSLFKTKHLPLQLGRGVIGFLGLFLLFQSCSLLPLSEATAISFAATIFITALSVPLLKEHVGVPQWIAVLVGFIGILVVIQPTGNINFLGAVAGLSSAVFEALIMILARILGRQDQAFTTAFYHTLVSLILSGLICFFEWTPPSMTHILMLAGLGVAGVLGQVFVTKAYAVAPAVVVAPILYTMIIWGGLTGYFIWGEVPEPSFYLGVLLVVASGIYIVYGETKQNIPHVQERDVL